MALVLQQNRLRWFGHVLRKEDDDWVHGVWSRGSSSRPAAVKRLCVCVCVIVDCSACFVADCISRQHNAIGQAHSSIRQFFPFSLACVLEDCQACKLNKEDAMDRCKWRKMIKEARWSGWAWVGECFFWYLPTRVVPDQRPLNGRCCWHVALSISCLKKINWSVFSSTGQHHSMLLVLSPIPQFGPVVQKWNL